MWSVLLTFPMAGLMALVYRFPVPFAGYQSGFYAMLLAMLSVIFYGVFLGGLVLVGTLGAIAAVLTAKLLNPASKHRKRVVFIAALGVTTVCLLVLANLDKMIGPW